MEARVSLLNLYSSFGTFTFICYGKFPNQFLVSPCIFPQICPCRSWAGFSSFFFLPTPPLPKLVRFKESWYWAPRSFHLVCPPYRFFASPCREFYPVPFTLYKSAPECPFKVFSKIFVVLSPFSSDLGLRHFFTLQPPRYYTSTL